MLARHRLEWVTAVVAAVLGAAYLLLPPLGSDLSAQVARAGFVAEHGYTPIDLRWYAGVDQLGYSLLSQPVMALLGVRVTGALALVASAVLLAVLFRRTGASRPWLGALVGTACIAGNLVSGRVTYALGVALALAALVALTSPRHRSLAAVAALLAAATSPVVALFLGLAGVALMLAGRLRDGLLIAVPAAAPLALTALLFGDGGWMNISRTDTLRAVVASLAVAALVPARPVRIGAALSAAGVLTAALIHTPVGLNATRLAVMFTLPVLAAYATFPRLRPSPHPATTAPPATAQSPATALSSTTGPLSETALSSGTASNPPTPADPPTATTTATSARPTAADRRTATTALLPGAQRRQLPLWAVVLLLAVACSWQPPVVVGDVRDMGNPTADPAYFTPLLARLGQETLIGRVEIPPTRGYWEAAHLGDVPLARGWLRQADIDRNPLFFAEIPGTSGTGVALTADSYRAWLADLAVQFVAVPDAELAWSGRPEAALVTAGLPYLTEIWRGEHWRLYAVADPRPIVAAPATLVSHTAAALTFDAPAAGEVAVRVRYYRWLTASGGATAEAAAKSGGATTEAAASGGATAEAAESGGATVEAAGVWTTVRVPGPGRYTLSSGLPGQ